MSAFVHMELSTTDPKRAVDFYKKLFGWKFSEMKTPDGGVYTGFSAEGGPGGGIQSVQMPGQPSAWLPYVAVKSVQAAITKAKDLGGVVIEDYMPIPGFGALGIVSDPTGAAIAFWEPAERVAAPKAAEKKAAVPKAPAKKVAAPAPKKKPAAAAKKPAATKKPAAKTRKK